MKVTPTPIPDVLVIEPTIFRDHRGFFFESFNAQKFQAATGLDVAFVQDNHSYSQHNILRGLHYQVEHVQGKLVRAIAGSIFDVAVDLRQQSPTFGRWVAETLTADNQRQLWIPPGFAHGFLVLSDGAEVLYKTTDYYAPQGERTIIWNDADLAIDWPHQPAPPVLSDKDLQGQPFKAAELFP